MTGLSVGTARAKRGEIVSGWFDGVDLPTGDIDRFPVLVAQGKSDGPVFWVTASIHGTEHTGLVAALRLATPELVAKLRGTLVIVPTLNPAGLRTKQRSPYYFNSDPNRLFPEPCNIPPHRMPNGAGIPSALETAYARLYDTIGATDPVALLDLHTAQIGSLPMVFRDPVFFHRGRARDRSRAQAHALQKRVDGLLEAFGLTVVNEFVADSYISKSLHRSVSGAVLNGLGVPAATVELGSWMHIDAGVVDACLAGLRNALRWAGMLDGECEPIEGIPVIRPPYPVRRHEYPYAPQAGIALPLVRPGEPVEEDQPLVRMVDIFGKPVGSEDGLLVSLWDGFVIGWQHGVVRYAGEAIMVLAVEDTSERVLPYPY